ncbi:hypothetical protein M2302_006566 [Micromonospora sp. A200]|nr:hypothetical protein [Micromonospora sp. A200]
MSTAPSVPYGVGGQFVDGEDEVVTSVPGQSDGGHLSRFGRHVSDRRPAWTMVVNNDVGFWGQGWHAPLAWSLSGIVPSSR